MRRFSLFIVFFVLNALVGYGQQFRITDFQKGVSLDFSIIDEKRIERGINILNNAYEMEKDAINFIETLAENDKLKASTQEYKKAVKKLIEASEVYREGFMILYTVYQENCLKFQETQRKINHYAAGVNKAKFYERKAEKAYERALSIRDLLAQMEKWDLIQYKMAEALELEKLSIRDRGRSLQIYQDFPVEYDYAWEDDVSQEQVDAAFKDPAISRPQDDLFVQSKTANPKQNSEKTVQDPIVFYVQIAAHTVPMSNEYIHEHIYAGNYKIREIYDGVWYKYSIGEFDNFNEAKSLLISSRVTKAFIVAYQNGNKLTIKEALTKIKQNQ
jgi:hypothetical protein